MSLVMNFFNAAVDIRKESGISLQAMFSDLERIDKSLLCTLHNLERVIGANQPVILVDGESTPSDYIKQCT